MKNVNVQTVEYYVPKWTFPVHSRYQQMFKYNQSNSLILRGNRTFQVTNNYSTGCNLFRREYSILGEKTILLKFLGLAAMLTIPKHDSTKYTDGNSRKWKMDLNRF